MSATNRGTEREDSDTYVTPGWSIERLLEAYTLPSGATVLDPCCASGELLTTLHTLRPDLRLIGFELREEVRPALEALKAAGVIAGFAIGPFEHLAKSLGDKAVDFIVSNPPYSLAAEFVEISERIAKVSIYLLRINFLGAQDRHALTDRTRPGLLTLANRPSFTGWGGDATEYAWFIYGDEALRGTWAPLPLTPEKVIKDWNAAARLKYPHLSPKVKAAAKAKKAALTGTTCSDCGEPQFTTPSGDTCENGHGGAPPAELPKEIAPATHGNLLSS